MQLFTLISAAIARAFAPRETPDPERLARHIDRAWHARPNHRTSLGAAAGFARARFVGVTQAYCIRYFRRTGELPSGWHDVLGSGRSRIYFVPEGRP